MLLLDNCRLTFHVDFVGKSTARLRHRICRISYSTLSILVMIWLYACFWSAHYAFSQCFSHLWLKIVHSVVRCPSCDNRSQFACRTWMVIHVVIPLPFYFIHLFVYFVVLFEMPLLRPPNSDWCLSSMQVSFQNDEIRSCSLSRFLEDLCLYHLTNWTWRFLQPLPG